ncbi:MAG: hypothetical protein M1813_001366 [Trichoglossum hirsutum]|nr:MAG: hypothetical protein M1813_001366 [Trichoglossum hirsutum]
MASPPPAQNRDRTSFLHLPLEIRQAIYSLVLDRSKAITVYDDSRYHRGQYNTSAGNYSYLGLLHVNRQVSEEARCLLYRQNTFAFYSSGFVDNVSRAWAVLHVFLLTIGERNCSYLRRVLVTAPHAENTCVSPWGIPVETERMWSTDIVDWEPIFPPVFGIMMKMMNKMPALKLDFNVTQCWDFFEDVRVWEGIMTLLNENLEGPKVRFVMNLALLRTILGPTKHGEPVLGRRRKLLPPDHGCEMVVVDSTDNSQLGFTLVLRDGDYPFDYTIVDGPKTGQRLTPELVGCLSSKDFTRTAG